jgi:histidine phosphotransferase ChpT
VTHKHAGFQYLIHQQFPFRIDMDPNLDCESLDLTALLGSRICHDLISPLGAIGNGVELLTMSGAASGPEVSLISQSVHSANARIRFFRVAFGAHGANQQIARSEILGILDDMLRGGRVQYDWQSPANMERGPAKLAFLALLCLETAMPYGGQIRIDVAADRWKIAARTQKLKFDAALWDRILGQPPLAPLAAAHVQFALFPQESRRQNRPLHLAMTDGAIDLTY